jgi:hypothetical protein
VRWQAHRLPVAEYDLTVINLGYLEVISHYWKSFFRHVRKYALLFHVHDENDVIKERRKELLRKWIQHAEHNLFASARTRNFLEKELSMKVPNAGILINPISFKAPDEQPSFPPLQDGNYQFVMLATLDTRRKAQDNLISALSVPKWKDRNWQLALYGGGQDEEKLRNRLHQLACRIRLY